MGTGKDEGLSCLIDEDMDEVGDYAGSMSIFQQQTAFYDSHGLGYTTNRFKGLF